MIKKCVICGKEFDARGTAINCSPECRKEYKRRKQHAYWHEHYYADVEESRKRRRESERQYRRAKVYAYWRELSERNS